jgi:hypothetical protein
LISRRLPARRETIDLLFRGRSSVSAVALAALLGLVSRGFQNFGERGRGGLLAYRPKTHNSRCRPGSVAASLSKRRTRRESTQPLPTWNMDNRRTLLPWSATGQGPGRSLWSVGHQPTFSALPGQ